MKASHRRMALALAVLPAVIACADVDVHSPEFPDFLDFPDARNTDFSSELSFFIPVTLSGQTTLRLDGSAGTVEIVGTQAGSDIVVEGTRRVRSDSEADAKRNLPDLQVEVTKTSTTVLVETRQPQQKQGRRYEVDYQISVPQDLDLAIELAAGRLDIASMRASVDVIHVAGDVILDDLEGNARITLVAGQISGLVTMPLDGSIDLAVTTGSIDLQIPRNTSARLRAGVGTGAITVQDLVLDDTDPRASVVSGTLAEGDGLIRLATVVGDISVTGM